MSSKQYLDQKILFRYVLNWLLSFVVLAVAAVLFVFCFLSETALYLYALCTAVFCLFIFFYWKTSKKIEHPDGYTLIQAMLFFRQNRKICKDENMLSQMERDRIYTAASNYDFAKDLSHSQIIQLFTIGQLLTKSFERK